jgi:hypothetical protein
MSWCVLVLEVDLAPLLLIGFDFGGGGFAHSAKLFDTLAPCLLVLTSKLISLFSPLVCLLSALSRSMLPFDNFLVGAILRDAHIRSAVESGVVARVLELHNLGRRLLSQHIFRFGRRSPPEVERRAPPRLLCIIWRRRARRDGVECESLWTVW